jgi:PST family polysaccharide transporter
VSLAREASEGLAWTGAAKSFAQIVGVVVTLALARLLTPEDFGLIAMVAVITGFLSVVGDMGFSASLIQKKELEERHRSSVFWLSVCLGVAIAGSLALGAGWIATVYRDPRLAPLIQVLGLGFVIGPLGGVQSAMLSRELRFRSLALADAVSALAGSAVALTLSLFGYGVWALCAQSLATTAALAAMNVVLYRWRPRFSFESKAISELSRFSANLFGHSLIVFWSGKFDDFLIGRMLGARPLGLYSRAYSTMMMPVTEIGGVLSRVMFPAFSQATEDKAELRRTYLDIVATIGFLTFPVMFVLAVLSKPFISLLFGPQWLGASTVLSIYSVVGASQAIASTTTWLYTSQGRTDLLFRWSLAAGVSIILAIAIGVWLGSIETVAICYAFTSVVVLSYPRILFAGRLIGLTVGDVFRAIRGALGCALLAAGVIAALGLFTTSRLGDAPDFVLRVGIALVAYMFLVRVAGAHGYQVFRAVVRRLIGASPEAKPSEPSA